jgi:hypothetical protein
LFFERFHKLQILGHEQAELLFGVGLYEGLVDEHLFFGVHVGFAEEGFGVFVFVVDGDEVVAEDEGQFVAVLDLYDFHLDLCAHFNGRLLGWVGGDVLSTSCFSTRSRPDSKTFFIFRKPL